MIYSGTLIQGPHSSIVLEENHQNVLLKENLITNLDAEGNPTSEWKITISKLQESPTPGSNYFLSKLIDYFFLFHNSGSFDMLIKRRHCQGESKE